MADTEQQLLEGQMQTEATRRELEVEELEKIHALDSSEEENQEIEYANQLASEQMAFQEGQSLDNVSPFSGPSLFKYAFILLFFAIPNDVIDVVDFTGFGMIFSWFISAFLSIITMIIMWFSDSEFKRVKSHLSNRGKYEQALTKTATKVAAKLSKFAPKNPLVKIIAGAVLEMIPIISILPWSSISVFMAYTDERRIYKEAKEAIGSGEISSLSTTAPEMV